jgi:hypothetical protein
MSSFELSGKDIAVRYNARDKSEDLFRCQDITVRYRQNDKSGTASKLTERTQILLRLLVPDTEPSNKDVAITGAAILVRDFSNLVGGAPAVLQAYDTRLLTGKLQAAAGSARARASR